MVIYYEQSYRAAVYGYIIQAAKLCKVESKDFSETISAFYHVVSDNNKKYHVGIALEANPNISFTESCANTILQQLTGEKIDLFDKNASAKKEEKYEIKDNIHNADELFAIVIKNCCKPFN